MSDDPPPEHFDYGERREDGQFESHPTVDDGEFVQPVRQSYVHDECDGTTTMGRDLAESFARDPSYYDATFCATCGDYFPVGEFTWDGIDKRLGEGPAGEPEPEPEPESDDANESGRPAPLRQYRLSAQALLLSLVTGNAMEVVDGIPRGADLVDAGYDPTHQLFYLTVEHEDFDLVHEGEEIPQQGGAEIEIRDVNDDSGRHHVAVVAEGGGAGPPSYRVVDPGETVVTSARIENYAAVTLAPVADLDEAIARVADEFVGELSRTGANDAG